ncbi:MAG: hypothetical protein H6744_20635 [Deltaproteobacteria bacterium]|nr:hypothetical protein [Deltaproteobacteria bacterium]
MLRFAALFIAMTLVCCTGEEGGEPPAGSLSAAFISPDSGTPAELRYVSREGDKTFLDMGMGAFAVSLDGEQTWRTYDLGNQSNPSDPNGLVVHHDMAWVGDADALVTTELGITRFDFAHDGFAALPDQPPGIWAVQPDTRRLFVLEQTLDEGTLSVDDDRITLALHTTDDYLSGSPTWTRSELPEPDYNPRRFNASLHFTDSGDIYVAHLFGLYRSADDGAHWEPVPVVPDEMGSLSWSGVDIFVTRAGTLFAITANDSFVSRDGGATWTGIYPNGEAGLRDRMPLMVQSLDDEVLYFSEGSLLASADEGRTWQPLLDPADFGTFTPEVEYVHHAADRELVDLRWWGALRAEPGGQALHPIGMAGGAAAQGSQVSASGPAFRFSTPGGESGYLAAWGTGIGRIVDGAARWTLGAFYPGRGFVGRLDDGTFLLAAEGGVRRSEDGGETWSEPAPVPSSKGPDDTEVLGIFEQPDGTLYLSGRSRAHCATYPHLTSSDGGRTWTLLTESPVITGANPGISQVEVRAIDRTGHIFGIARAISASVGVSVQCSINDSVPVRSDDGGATWLARPDILLPDLVTHANTLVHVDDDNLLLWRQGAERWAEMGPLDFPDAPTFAWRPFVTMALDADDHILGTFEGRVWRSTQVR